MKTILNTTLALALLAMTGFASAQSNRDRDRDRDRDQRNDRYSRDWDDRNSYGRNDSRDWERQRNSIWRDLFARQEDERREFYRCTPYRKGSREYNRALDRIVDRQECERAEMRDRLSRQGSYRGR